MVETTNNGAAGMVVRFAVPGLPPSANERIGAHVHHSKAKLHRKEAATAWQDTVAAYGRAAMARRPLIDVPCVVLIVFSLTPKRRRDTDAGIKDTQDGLRQSVIVDDRLVECVTALRTRSMVDCVSVTVATVTNDARETMRALLEGM